MRLGHALLVAALLAPAAAAQVVARPNQVSGTFTLTNANPAIIDLLQTRGFGSLMVIARSTSPPMRASTAGVRLDALHARYEITVEGGTPGIPYAITATPGYDAAASRLITTMSQPVEPEPAPDAIVDFEECMGVVTVRLVDPSGAPVIDANATVNGTRPAAGSNEVQFLLPTGMTLTLTIAVLAGSDPLRDTVILEYPAGSAVARCDVTVDRVVDPDPLGAGSGIGFGSIVGNLDVLGAQFVAMGRPDDPDYSSRSSVNAAAGPFGNSRWDVLNTPGRLRGAYELENLVASGTTPEPRDYLVLSRLALDVDGVTELMQLPDISVNVPAGAVVDLGDTLVVDPSDVRGAVRLVGPPPHAARGRAMLADVQATATAQGLDELADGATWTSSGLACRIDSADERYDDASSSMSATWRLLTGGLAGQPSVQELATSFTTAHADTPPVPNDWYAATFGFDTAEAKRLELHPGDMRGLPFEACVGQVLIGFRSTDAPFHDPRITAYGRLDGVDFQGNLVARSSRGFGRGLPQAVSDAANSGSVKLCLPEGDYQLSPSVFFVNPSGGTSSTALRPVDLHVGCRQVVTGTPEIVARMTRAPSCAGTLPVMIAGSVSADEEIASITWNVDGGAETDACRPCGIDPGYEILVPGTGTLQMQIVVKATDVLGREATVTHFARLADEPSAMDLDPSATPLMVTRSAEGMRVTWGLATGVSYSLYRGSIATLHAGRYDHAAFGACGLASPEWSGALPAADSYFLASSACGFGDSPLGRDSFGRDVPGAGPRCP